MTHSIAKFLGLLIVFSGMAGLSSAGERPNIILLLADDLGPRQHGFDFYQTLFRHGGTVLLRNDQHVTQDDPYFSKHFTDANGDFAVELIGKLSTEQNPFFINMWWLVPCKSDEPAPEPHWSATSQIDISENQHRIRSMVQHMDAKVGQILGKLDDLGIADNTLVLFTSDNGAAYEGFIGDLKGESPVTVEERGTVFWQLNLYKSIQRHYPKPKPYATEVAMNGKWKLLALKGEPVELFDIESDPNEQKNGVDDHPSLVASLSTELNEWLNAPRITKSK